MSQLTHKDLTSKVLTNPINFIAFGFGSGLLPKAPGTWGTVIALPIWYFMSSLSLTHFISMTAVLSIVGIWLCDYSAKNLQVHDHPGIVWDEICGYLITMIAVPVDWRWMLLGFVLFRFFDIIKPWPIRWLDKKVKGGFGIMIDDIIAGIFAGIILQLAIYFFT